MSQIKRIMYKGNEIPLVILDEDLQIRILQLSRITKSANPGFVDCFGETIIIEYEPETPEPETPKLLKRPDGSLISEPEEGAEVLIISDGGYLEEYTVIKHCYESKADNTELKKGLIYLKEDTDLAEKKAQQLTKQLEIQNEIGRLNAMEGWVADWNWHQDKYYVSYSDNSIAIFSKITSFENAGNQYMSKTTAETILDKYSQEELKQYLNIIL